MGAMGHTTASLTLQVYARAMKIGDGERAALRHLVGTGQDSGDLAEIEPPIGLTDPLRSPST